MVILAAEHIHVQRDAGGLGETVKGVRDHLGVELTDTGSAEAKFADKEGTSGDVDDGAGEGLVERGVGVAEAGDAAAGAEGSRDGSADSEEGVFSGVVVVD